MIITDYFAHTSVFNQLIYCLIHLIHADMPLGGDGTMEFIFFHHQRK